MPVQAVTLYPLKCPRGSKESWAHSSKYPSWWSNTTTSLTQPFNKKIITTFKRHYTLCIFHSAFDPRKETFITVSKYWKRYITVDCLITIQESGWAKVHGSEQLLGEALAWTVYDFWGLSKQQNEIRNILLSQTLTQPNSPVHGHLNPSPYHNAKSVFKDT